MTHRPAAVALAASMLLYAVALAIIPATGDQDGAIRAIYAEHPTDASRALSVWSRPVFALPAMAIAPLGYTAIRVFVALTCALAGWLTYLAARRWGLPNAWLAIPFGLLQPCLYQVGTEALTEPAFAALLAGGLLAASHGRMRTAALVWSLLPLARPEGPIVLAVIAAFWLRDRAWRRVALLATGCAVWEAACIVVTGDALYLLHTFPWAIHTPEYSGGPAWHFLWRWPAIVGAGAIIPWVAGLRPSWKSDALRLPLAITLAVLAVHSALFALRGFGSTGFDRYFAAVAPATALVAVAGAPFARHAAWLAALLAAQALHAFVSVDAPPVNHGPAATREMIGKAALDGRPVLFADLFGYVFTGRDRGPEAPPAGPKDVTAPFIERYPSGSVAIWDNITGEWWFHLTPEDFVARGWRIVSDREFRLGSPRAAFYDWFVPGDARRPFRQTILEKP